MVGRQAIAAQVERLDVVHRAPERGAWRGARGHAEPPRGAECAHDGHDEARKALRSRFRAVSGRRGSEFFHRFSMAFIWISYEIIWNSYGFLWNSMDFYGIYMVFTFAIDDFPCR